MSNAIVKVDFTTEELAVIKKQFFPAGGSPAEQQYCFAVARELGLNPITREIFFVPRRQKINGQWAEKIEPMVGRDGFLAIAHRTTQLSGIETFASIRNVPQLVGASWKEQPDLVAECRVWRKDSDKPFTVQVAYSEYVQKNNDGQPTKFWAEKPETMLKKVAESQALRKAFNIHGVYSPEEMGAGFETDSGDLLISPTIEAEYASNRSKNVLPPIDPEAIEMDDDTWPPVGPTPKQSSAHTEPSSLGNVASLLASKGIKFELDEECGYIAAKAFAHKDFLKSLGFRWQSEEKLWVWTEVREAA